MFGLFRQKPDPVTLFEALIASVSYEWDTACRTTIPFMGMCIEAVTSKQLEANDFKLSRSQIEHIRIFAMIIEMNHGQLR